MKSKKGSAKHSLAGLFLPSGKKGFSFIVSAILVIVILIAGAIFIYQQKQKTEKNFFGTLWGQFFPEKTDQIVIPGTTAGKGCAHVRITSADELAREAITCWQLGKKQGGNYPCCAMIESIDLTTGITESDWTNAQKNLQPDITSKITWNVGVKNFVKGASAATLCFDYNAFGDEVYLTFNPVTDCG
jgi:hypothetical protein